MKTVWIVNWADVVGFGISVIIGLIFLVVVFIKWLSTKVKR